MNKLRLLISISFIYLVGFTNINSMMSNKNVLYSNAIEVDQVAIISNLSKSEKSSKINGNDIKESNKETGNASIDDIKNIIAVISTLIGIGVIAVKAVPQISYLHKSKLKDHERLSYDLNNVETREKYMFYIILAEITILSATLWLVVFPNIEIFIFKILMARNIKVYPILIVITETLIYILVLMFYRKHLKKVEDERNKKVLTITINEDKNNELWFLFKRTEDGGFIFSRVIYIGEEIFWNPQDIDKKSAKEFSIKYTEDDRLVLSKSINSAKKDDRNIQKTIIEYTEQKNEEDQKLLQLNVTGKISISNNMTKLKYQTQKEVIDSFYGYAEVYSSKKNN